MKTLLPVLILALATSTAFASGKAVVATVNGMVCAFCAQGITKKLGAEPAVEKVEVSLEQKTVKVTLKEGKNIDDKQLESILKDSGYNVEKISRSQ
jgi:mercuric ion binding protein